MGTSSAPLPSCPFHNLLETTTFLIFTFLGNLKCKILKNIRTEELSIITHFSDAFRILLGTNGNHISMYCNIPIYFSFLDNLERKRSWSRLQKLISFVYSPFHILLETGIGKYNLLCGYFVCMVHYKA